MFVGQDAACGVDGGEGDVAALAFVVGLGDGELCRQVADEYVEELAVGKAIRRGTAKIRQQDLLVARPVVDPLCERLPVGRPVHHQIDEPILAAIGARGHRSDEPRPDTLRNYVVLEPFADARNVGDRGHRFETRHVDLLAAARAVAIGQGDETAAGGECRGDDVCLLARKANRRILGITDRDHGAAEGARDEIVRAEGALRPRLPEARDRGQDESRMSGAEGGEGEPTLGEIADRMALDHEIDGRRERAKSLAIRLLVEIEDDASLVAVRVGEPKARGSLALVVERSAPTTALATRRLDLHDVGSEIRQELPAVGGALRRKIEHAQSRECAGAHLAHLRLRVFDSPLSSVTFSPLTLFTPTPFRFLFPVHSPGMRLDQGKPRHGYL